MLEALNPAERRILFDEVKNLKKEKSITEQQCERMDYLRTPPSMEQFIVDPYYFGQILLPSEDSTGLFPAWRDILIRDFNAQSRVHNVVVSGAMGTGKTFCSVTILLYRITLATLLRDPQHFFGLSRGVNIIYGILSVTKESVRQTAFGDALNFMAHSGYFINELHFDPAALYSRGVIHFRNGVYLTAGSKSWHILGRNVLGVLLDEGNVRLEQNPDQSAYNLYGEIRTRIVNRFQKVEGNLPAISIIASSASDESSFTERLIKEIDDAKTPTTQKVYREPVYKIKRHELKLGKRWFKVAYGLKNQEPIILGGWFLENSKHIVEDGPVEDPPRGARTELVPELYWPDFRRNCRRALQDISGISTSGTHRLFPTMIDFERCIELSEKESLRNPVKGNVRLIPLSKDDDLNVWDYLDHNAFLTRAQSLIRPLRHPNSMRYAHLDLATQSKAGLSICHLVGATKVEGIAVSGHPFDEYRMIVEFDFILGIVAGPVSSISFNKICNFFFWLRSMCGFRFGKITADMFNSHQMLESLDSAGIPTELLSLDRDKTVYLSLRSGIEDHRVRMYRQPDLLEEVENLLEENKKFDHPVNGSKDLADALGGAYYNAITSEERSSLLTEASPSVYANSEVASASDDKPIVEIPLPPKPPRPPRDHHV